MSGVSNGQDANATNFNAAFLAKNGDDTTIGVVNLANTATAASGPATSNVQRILNSLASAIGVSTGLAFDGVVTWASTVVGLASSTVVAKIEALVLKFRSTSINGGHTHDGTEGNGPLLEVAAIADLNPLSTKWQKVSLTAITGDTADVSAEFASKDPGGGLVLAGVITTGAKNRVVLLDPATNTPIDDGAGNIVYGRLTESAGTWTLSFYVDSPSVETPYSATALDVDVYFREVFTREDEPAVQEDPWEFGLGSGAGEALVRYVDPTIRSIAAAGDLSSFLNGNYIEQTIRVQSTGGEVSPAAALFGTTFSSLQDGMRVTLIGVSDTDFIKPLYGNVAGGLIGPFSEISLQFGKTVTFELNKTEDRWFHVGGSLA